MKNFLAVGVGAALGTYLRYFINVQTQFTGYPVGTLIENLMGSLLLGLLSGYFATKKPKEWVKAGLGVGLCGGFTTFSTFAADTIGLYLQENMWLSLCYILITLPGGISLAMAGFLFGQKIGGRTT
ncbi:CrcB family protein [Salibacterium salarium]|uniref:Fluoride-specific ion channel FluC n=1 Tax=Salibacterium salarium TaxID=284579 RepID=A0A428N452_9BACI|nr:CrcB family protein [Salibacterium salarium]RSL33059.1 CrcB family protein [Salibacterium salarium]